MRAALSMFAFLWCVPLSDVAHAQSRFALDDTTSVTRSMTVALGKGWDPYFPYSLPPVDCFRTTGGAIPPEASEGSSIEHVEHASSALERSGLAFRTGSGPLSAGLGTDSSVRTSDRTVTWVMYVWRRYKYSMPETSLTERGRAILSEAQENGDLEPFFQQCGRVLITQAHKEIRLAVVYQFTASSSERAQAISAFLRTRFPGASARLDFTRDIEQRDAQASLRVWAFQDGVLDHHSALARVVAEDRLDLPRILRAAGDALNTFTEDAAVTTMIVPRALVSHLTLGSTDDRLGIASTVLRRLQQLRESEDALWSLRDAVIGLQQITAFLAPGSRERLAALHLHLDQRETAIREAARRCERATTLMSCPDPFGLTVAADDRLSGFDPMSFLARAPFEFKGWRGDYFAQWNARGHGRNRGDFIEARLAAWPAMVVDMPELVEAIHIVVDGALQRVITQDEVGAIPDSGELRPWFSVTDAVGDQHIDHRRLSQGNRWRHTYCPIGGDNSGIGPCIQKARVGFRDTLLERSPAFNATFEAHVFVRGILHPVVIDLGRPSTKPSGTDWLRSRFG